MPQNSLEIVNEGCKRGKVEARAGNEVDVLPEKVRASRKSENRWHV